MDFRPINDSARSSCRNDLSHCGKEAVVAGMAIELDNKFVAVGTIITVVAGWFLSLSSTIIGLSFILVGTLIFLTKRSVEMIKRLLRNKRTEI